VKFSEIQDNSFEAKIEFLRDQQVQGFLDYSWRMRRRYHLINTVVLIAGIALSAAVTVVGTLGEAPYAGILGAGITFLLGIQSAFRFSQKANVWEVKHGEAKMIRDRLRYPNEKENCV
jgi:hypothetical protein